MSREALAIKTAGLSKRYRSTWGIFLVLALALAILTYWSVTIREA